MIPPEGTINEAQTREAIDQKLIAAGWSVLVDGVCATETDKIETKSLETKPSVSTANPMQQIARGDRNADTLRALGNRMDPNYARKAA